MKINWIEYENIRTGLKINRLSFNDLTLLVGVSGAGKTNILDGIGFFKKIVQREYTWDMFETALGMSFEIEGNEYEWHIKFGKESVQDYENKIEDKGNIKVPVLEELLLIDNYPHFKKQHDGIMYKGTKIPGLSHTMSCINLFEGDDIVKKVSTAFEYVLMYSTYSEQPEQIAPLPREAVDRIKASGDISNILQGDSHPYAKLCFLQAKQENEIFEDIKQVYCDIFKTVEDLYFELDKNTNAYVLYQAEKDVPAPIRYESLSSGMFKVLLLLTNIFTCREGSVFLIDEFENSFGVNCLEEVVEIVQDNEDMFQFIITSHHPYIINNVDITDWSVVERKGSVITARPAKELKIGSTRHDAFFELINYWDYEENSI